LIFEEAKVRKIDELFQSLNFGKVSLPEIRIYVNVLM